MPKPKANPAPDLDLAMRPVEEAYELWKSGCELWLDYLTALPKARTPEALLEANTTFLARCLELSGLAAGRLLKDAGLKAPVLNDA